MMPTLALVLLSAFSFAQHLVTVNIKSADGSWLEGTSLQLKGSTVRNGLTNENGRFVFRNIPAEKFILHASFTGMVATDTTITIAANTEVTLTLQSLPSALLPAEVRGLRAGNDAPFAKTDVSRSYIEKNNTGQDIPFLLNQTPNVVINSDAGNGVGYTGIRIRGTDATRINMTINGIPYNDAESQGTYFVDLPDLLSSTSSIQIQRGVGTSSNGPGAFGGTLNLSTYAYNPAAYAELNNSYGSFNTLKNTVKLGSGLMGKHFTFDARLSNISSDGYIDRASSHLQSGQFTLGYWAGKSSLRFNAILGKEKTYQAWYGVKESDLASNRTVNYAGTEKPGDPYKNETDNYWQNHYQLFFNHEFNPNVVFNTAFYLTTGRGYYEQYKAGQTLADYGIAPINGTTETDLIRQLWLQNKLWGQIISLQVNKGLDEWAFGGGWSYYPGSHFGKVVWTEVQPNLQHEYYRQQANKADANVYAKWTHHLNDNWKLFTDLQYRYVHYKIDGFQYNPAIQIDEQWNFLNPKAGISYAKKNWSGFLSYAMSNNTPNRDDFEAGKNEMPKPEHLHDFELNITKKEVLKNLQLAATFYYMYYRDQLVLTGKVNDVGSYTRQNIPKSYRAGAELEAAWCWKSGSVKYSAGLSSNKILDFTEYIDDYDNGKQQVNHYSKTDIALSPSVVQQGTISFVPLKQTELQWMAKYVGRQFLDNTSQQSRSLDPYFVNDLRASYSFHGRKILKEARLIFQVNNLFDVKYEPSGYTFSYYYNNALTTENYYYPMATRNWMVALNIKF